MIDIQQFWNPIDALETMAGPMDVEAAKRNLLEMKEVLDRLKVKWWLWAGVLLGAVRDKDLIPYDVDMDITILARDWRPSICEELKKSDFKCGEVKIYRSYIGNKASTVGVYKRGIRTDIRVVFYYPPDDVYVCITGYPNDHGSITPAKFCRGDCFIDFLGKSFRVPSQPEEFLEYLYGKDWRTPMEEGWDKDRRRISLDKYLKWFSEHPEREWLR